MKLPCLLQQLVIADENAYAEAKRRDSDYSNRGQFARSLFDSSTGEFPWAQQRNKFQRGRLLTAEECHKPYQKP